MNLNKRSSAPIVALFLSSLAATALIGCGGTLPLSSLTASPSPSPTASPSTSRFIITDLGVPAGSTTSDGTAIDAAGDVVGEATNGAFVWQSGNLLALNGPTTVFAYGVNNFGQIALGNKNQEGSNHSYLYQNGTYTDLGTLSLQASDFTIAYGINDSQQVVGNSGNTASWHAFVWQGGVMDDLGDPGGSGFSTATAINSNGQIAVRALVGTTANSYLWSKNSYTKINALSGDVQTLSNGISNSGQIVGECDTAATGGTATGFTWTNGTTLALAPLFGDSQSIAVGINNKGQIVGRSLLASTGTGGTSRAVLWENNTAEDLNGLIPTGSGWTLSTAVAVNDNGDITGAGVINGVQHAYLLTPR